MFSYKWKGTEVSHKAQNAVLQWWIVTNNVKKCGKYKYRIISKLNKKRKFMFHLLLMQILYFILNVFYQHNQQPLDKLSNSFA